MYRSVPDTFILCLLFWHLSCAGLKTDSTLFYDWFLNNGAKQSKELIANVKTAANLKKIPKPILPQECKRDTVLLMDRTGSAYIVGYSTPKSWNNNRKYPLLIYLHGGIGNARYDKGRTAYDMFSFVADSIPLFLASPTADSKSPWWSPLGMERILMCLRFMTLHFPIDPDRIILSGVSDGATGCYAAANTINSYFAGFIAISGFGGMLPRLGITLSIQNLKQRPLYNVNAGKDRIYPVALVNLFLDSLQVAGVEIKRKIYPDEGHGFDYRLQETHTILNLIKTWKKPHSNRISGEIVPGMPIILDNILTLDSPQQSAAITSVWKKDTLEIRQKSLSRLQLILGNRSSDSLFVKYADHLMTIPADHLTPELYLHCLQYFGSPHIPAVRIFTLSFE